MAITPSITIRTNFTPDITFNPFSKSNAAASKNFIFDILKPSIDGELPIVGAVHYAPNGEPSGYGIVLAGLVAVLAVYGAWKLIVRRS